MTTCSFCGGDRTMNDGSYTAYSRYTAPCPRCNGSGVEPKQPMIHASMLMRNVRSGKVWAVFGDYSGTINDDGVMVRPPDWGIHRMKPSRTGGHYVWQIIHRNEEQLLDPKVWTHVGFGDAWDHGKMEADELPARSAREGA